MKNVFYLLGALFLLACQADKDGLSPGDTVEGELVPPEIHSYELRLNEDDFFALIVAQKGIDVMIRLIGPDGSKIQDFDSPNGKWGNEFVSHYTDTVGIYTLEIHPLNENEPGGRYTLELLKNEPRGATPQKQVDQLFSFWDRKGSPGAAVSIAKDGEILYSKGYGYANLEYDIPIIPATIFHIASVSKQFTAYSIALLADQGLLSLDDDIRTYLPELNDFEDTITIRHLVHHTSGLRDQWNLLAMAGWRLDDVITREQILHLISRQNDLNFRPGEEMVYCNTGYTLMAEIVSRVSGKPFAEWTKENIFIPLNMDHTLFYDDHELIVPGRAYSYSEDRNGYKKSVLSYANVGATSLFTTVEDIQRWADNFRTMKVGNEHVMHMMDERGILNNGDTLDYAFGQIQGNYRGLPIRSHGGGDAGYRTFLLRFPDQGYAISVFSNLGSFNTGGLAFQVANIYLKDMFEAGERERPEYRMAENETVQLSDSLLQEYAGRYLFDESILFEILVENEKLAFSVMGQPAQALIPRSDTTFYHPGFDLTVAFRRNSERQIDRLGVLFTGGEDVATKLPPFDPESIDFEELTGVFYSDELQTAYDFIIDHDTLKAFHQRHDPIRLTPMNEDEFMGDAWFFSNIKFIRDQKGNVDGCQVSSGRVRNVYFEKVE